MKVFTRKDSFRKLKDWQTPSIHRVNVKTFKSISSEKRPTKAKKKDQTKTAQAQRTLDLARVRGYDIRHLFKYDLVPLSYLLDGCGFMTDPKKSTLCNELEKKLKPEDYVHSSAWTYYQTAYVVDIMACMICVRAKTFGNLIDRGS